MKKSLLWVALTATLCSCAHSVSHNDSENTIEVLSAWENQTELTCSQLGKSIRYVPLETTDSSLIGDSYHIQLLKNYILVTTDKRALLFDKQTGKFLCPIGHLGDDPEGYLTNVCFVNHGMEEFCFPRHDKLIKYNSDGKYVGEMDFPSQGLSTNCYPLLTGSSAWVYQGQSFGGNGDFQLFHTSGKGEKTDSIVLQKGGSTAVNPSDIQSISVFKGAKSISILGLMAHNGLIIIDMKDDKGMFMPSHYPSLWHSEKNIRFREPFGDTIFNVKDKGMEPYKVFNLGERRFPKEKEGQKIGTAQYLSMTYVMETPQVIYFQCAKDLYGKREMYNGVYNKNNGRVGVNKISEGFKDDLTHFMPFSPIAYSPEGEFAAAIQPTDILEWKDEQGEAHFPEILKELKDDDNPVCVIVAP